MIRFARAVLVVTPMVACFAVVTALCASVVEDERVRFAVGFVVACVVPLLVVRDGARGVALFDAMLTLALAFGFADDVGRALRRHGDWFLGERSGWVARETRRAMAGAATYLERFDPPAEIAPVVIAAEGPVRPGERPPGMEAVTWFHPLAGPRRALPLYAARRFGATRPQPRPSECELGHCGVDLGTTVGEPVFAVADGVVERVERDESNGGRAGRYVRIAHAGAVASGRTPVTRYIHLDTIRADLKEGARVRGGEMIGRIGRTGIEHAGAHLHFGLSLRAGAHGAREEYVDPEPMLRTWKLPEIDASRVAVGGHSDHPSTSVAM